MARVNITLARMRQCSLSGTGQRLRDNPRPSYQILTRIIPLRMLDRNNLTNRPRYDGPRCNATVDYVWWSGRDAWCQKTSTTVYHGKRTSQMTTRKRARAHRRETITNITRHRLPTSQICSDMLWRWHETGGEINQRRRIVFSLVVSGRRTGGAVGTDGTAFCRTTFFKKNVQLIFFKQGRHSHSYKTANIALVGLHLERQARPYQRDHVGNYNLVRMRK